MLRSVTSVATVTPVLLLLKLAHSTDVGVDKLLLEPLHLLLLQQILVVNERFKCQSDRVLCQAVEAGSFHCGTRNLAGPVQRLVTAGEALVVLIVVDGVEEESEPGRAGDVYLVHPPAVLQRVQTCPVFRGDQCPVRLQSSTCVSPRYRHPQSDHLPDLVQHEALPLHGDHTPLQVSAHHNPLDIFTQWASLHLLMKGCPALNSMM